MQKGPTGGWGGLSLCLVLAEAWLLGAILFTCVHIFRGKKCMPLRDA